MLNPNPPKPLSKIDLVLLNAFVSEDHYLRKVLQAIDFESFRARCAAHYSPDFGRYGIDPVRMLKILFLCFHYRLSDRQVMERAATDMAFRWFLGLGRKEELPHHTNGTHFRNRLSEEGFKQVFEEVLRQARARGLVNDRLRLKDATHILANIAEVRPLVLLAQVREGLWKAAKPFFADTVSQQRAAHETLRTTTAELPDEQRLLMRVKELREITAVLHKQLEALLTPPVPITEMPTTDPDSKGVKRLQRALATATKLLADCDHPQAGDRLASAIDSEARCHKHTTFYVGYLLDITMDPVSELITAVNVMAANGPEAEDAVTLIRQEEQAQGNKVEGLSTDGCCYNGPVLRQLTDPNGLNLDVTVPPPESRQWPIFPAERFPLTVLDNGTPVVTCPANQTSNPGKPNPQKYTRLFRFQAKHCRSCPLREQCLENSASTRGRTVQKNDYQAEYNKVHAKAKTPEYAETRRVHPKVERKINEVARHQQCRRARYRGIGKTLRQALLTTMVVNVKRIVKLVAKTVDKVVAAVTLRAEPAKM